MPESPEQAAASKAAIEAAIGEAIVSTGFQTDEDRENDLDDGEEEEKDESQVDSGAAAPKEGATGTETDPPLEYWGVSLADIDPEKRAEIIAHFEQQDSTIRKLQDKVAREPVAPAAPEGGDQEVEVTDEDILRALGIDPEYGQEQGPVLRLARTVMELEDRLENLSERETVRETETLWNGTLDELEGTYGKLPFERIQVLQYALDNDLTSPFEAYFAISAPVRREVSAVAQAARVATAKRDAGGGLKPSKTAAGEPEITKDMSLRDAVALAAKAASREHKVTWREAAKRKLVRVDE